MNENLEELLNAILRRTPRAVLRHGVELHSHPDAAQLNVDETWYYLDWRRTFFGWTCSAIWKRNWCRLFYELWSYNFGCRIESIQFSDLARNIQILGFGTKYLIQLIRPPNWDSQVTALDVENKYVFLGRPVLSQWTKSLFENCSIYNIGFNRMYHHTHGSGSNNCGIEQVFSNESLQISSLNVVEYIYRGYHYSNNWIPSVGGWTRH